MSKDLNPKQIAFCREYSLNGNAKQSYISAGYSEKTAEQGSSQLLSNIKVKDYLDKLREKGAKKFEFTRETAHEMLSELYNLHKIDNGSVAKGSVDSMLKMYGLNEADKIDLTSKGEALGGFEIVVDNGTKKD
jgi:phage terminase small subunit